MRMVTTCLVLAIIACATNAMAQWRGGWGGGWGRGGGYHHASTAGEGYMRGMGDLVRSAGAANLMNSEAANRYEEARSKYLDNRLKATQTYFEMKRVNRAERQASGEFRQAPTAEEMFRMNESRKPRELDTSDLDPVEGTIAWPLLLQDDMYKEDRKAIESVFANRAKHNGHMSRDDSLALQQASESMRAALKTQVRNVSANDYIRATGFLKSLLFEARS